MRAKLLTAVLSLSLCGCGVYTGSEGIKYLGDSLTGFRTPSVDKQIEDDRKQAYADGLAKSKLSKASKLEDGSVTLVTKDQVMCAGGSALTAVLPFAGPVGGVLTLIIGGIMATRRKEDEDV